MNRDQIEGKWDQLVGSVKQAWGKLTDDDILRAEGSAEKLYGIIQERFGDSREAIKDKLRHLESKLSSTADAGLRFVKFSASGTGGPPDPSHQPKHLRGTPGPLDRRIDADKAEEVEVGTDPTPADTDDAKPVARPTPGDQVQKPIGKSVPPEVDDRVPNRKTPPTKGR